jgi:hypothetical protein
MVPLWWCVSFLFSLSFPTFPVSVQVGALRPVSHCFSLRYINSTIHLAQQIRTSQISRVYNHATPQAKPADRSAWWRRARLDRDGTLTLRSRQLRWWLLTLGLEAHANPRTRTANLSYRVATKWDVSKGEYRNKRRAGLGDAAEARAHWSVNYNLPEVAG